MENIQPPPPMTFEQVMAIIRESNEVEKQLREKEMANRDAKWEAEQREFRDRMENLSRRFGDLSNRFGEVVEGLVSPNLIRKFDKFGFSFGGSATNYKITEGKKSITEIDVLLRDGDCLMVVEVKTKPVYDDITKHLWRMDQVVKYADDLTRNKKIYGAIACAVLDDDVRDAAFKAGFYVVCQSGDSVDIVLPPADFVAKVWDATIIN